MSFSLDAVSLTGATAGTTGTVSWANLAQSAGYGIPEAGPPHLALLNESPCGLQLQFSTGEQMSLPAGGWQTITLNPTCTNVTYTVLYVLNASPIVSSLLGTWYAPGEQVPDAPILGNSPIGAAVATSPFANALQGVNQAQAVTEIDRAGVFAGPILIPTSLGSALWLQSGDSTSFIIVENNQVIQIAAPSNIFLNGPVEAGGALTADTTLGVTGATTLNSTLGVTGATTLNSTLGVTGATTLSSTLNVATSTTLSGTLSVSAAVTLTNKVTTYNNEATAGVGLPYIVAIAQNTSVASIVLTSILTYTTPNDGANHSLRVNAWCDVNNSVSGNNIQLQVVYSDPRSGGTTITPFTTATSTASQSFNAVSSITNGIYAMYPYMIFCKPNTTVTIQYRDPTNTPADHVSAFIERIS